MQIPRSAAFVVIGVGIAALGYGILSQRAAMETPTKRVSVAQIQNAQPLNASDQLAALSTEMPVIALPAHPPLGRTVHVRNEWPSVGSGTQGDPYRDLDRALCALQPGDRLIIWPGRYDGPIEIGDQCANGTEERPIEVVLAAGALFFGIEGLEAPRDIPLLSVDRSHWHFYELELEPHWMRPAMRVSQDNKGIKIIGAHILKGVGHGVELQAGVSEVSILDTHMHHLGTLRGAQRNFRDPEAAGVAIGPSAFDIVLGGLVMHHMEGDAVRALNSDGTLASAEALAQRSIHIGDIRTSAMQGQWD